MPQSPTPWRAPIRRPAPPPEGFASTDQEIVAALARGEAWAADRLYDRVQPVLERTLRRVIRSGGADHDDLMQASFERIIRALADRPLGGACDLAAWSSVVATHVALDVLRRQVRERKLFCSHTESDAHPGFEASPERSLEARAAVVRVQRVLARMKPKHAETVVLHDVLGHDLNEIAMLSGVSVAAVQSRLVRGRRELVRRARAERKP